VLPEHPSDQHHSANHNNSSYRKPYNHGLSSFRKDNLVYANGDTEVSILKNVPQIMKDSKIASEPIILYYVLLVNSYVALILFL